MDRPRVIHDFYGFPKALFDFDYPAPGSVEVAREVVDVVRPKHVSLDGGSWGIDHGTWSVLAHVFPDASIPVVQLSIDAGASAEDHMELGAALAPLRERGVFILGSGNVVHNLRRIDWKLRDRAFDWGERFDRHVEQVMTQTPSALREASEHPDFALAVPTTEHFAPLLYLAGLCQAAGETAKAFAEGGTLGSITMTSYLLGADCPPAPSAAAGAASLPDPAIVPPEQTNV